MKMILTENPSSEFIFGRFLALKDVEFMFSAADTVFLIDCLLA